MDAFLQPLLASFLAEWGDRTQLLAMMLALRYRGSPMVLAGIANALISAAAGNFIGTQVNFRALTLLTAIALLCAGGAALLPQRPPKLRTRDGGIPFLCSFMAFGILEFGDKTQFLTLALAGQMHSFWLVGTGAAVGVILANAPAVLVGHRLPALLPLRSLRISAGILLLISGVIAGLIALQLI